MNREQAVDVLHELAREAGCWRAAQAEPDRAWAAIDSAQDDLVRALGVLLLDPGDSPGENPAQTRLSSPRR